jgi:type I restriction enzyme S subunit
MKEGWQARKLGDVAQVSAGNSAPQDKSLFADGTYPFFRTADAGRVRFGEIFESTDYLNSDGAKGLRRYPIGTILFPKSGASTFLNHRVLLGVEGYVSSHLATIVADRAQVEPRFLLYFLSTIYAQDLVQDHAYPSLNHPAISGIIVQAPPLPEQQRIVALLDEAFAGIATAKVNAERNLQNARAIFKSYLQSVFSQWGEGWPTKQLGDVCDFQGGSQPPKSEFVYEPKPGYVRFLQIRDYASERHLTYIPESSKNRLCNADDIMIGRYGASVGKILTGRAGAYNVALVKTIPDLELLDRDFFFNYLASGAFQGCLADVASRSAQNGFSKDGIYGFPVPVPPLSEQRMVIEQLNPLDAETQRLTRLYERKLAALEELKKSLLHQAFNGEL